MTHYEHQRKKEGCKTRWWIIRQLARGATVGHRIHYRPHRQTYIYVGRSRRRPQYTLTAANAESSFSRRFRLRLFADVTSRRVCMARSVYDRSLDRT